MISSVLLILAVVAGFAVVMTKDMAPAAPKATPEQPVAQAAAAQETQVN